MSDDLMKRLRDTIDDLTRRHQHALHKIDVLEDEIDVLKAKLTTAVDALSYYANHDLLLLYDDASFAKDTIATIK